MSFDQLKTALDEGQALDPMRVEESAFDGESLEDKAALKLVVQNADFGEKFVQSKGLPNEWTAADDLFRALVQSEAWGGGSNKQRSAIPMPVIMEAIRVLLPQFHMAFFSDPQPFLLDPKGKTSPDAARAMAHLVCWAIKESGFEEEFRKFGYSYLLYGMGIGKKGWLRTSKQDRKYQRDGKSVKATVKTKEISRPSWEYVSLRNIIVDPYCDSHDIRRAGWVIFRKWINADELDSLRDMYDNVPTKDELRAALANMDEFTRNTLKGLQDATWRAQQAMPKDQQASADPLKMPLELLEYWDDGRVITVLQRCIMLENAPHEFDEKPFNSAAFIDVLNSFYGYGVAKLLAGEQHLQVGVVNRWVDSLALTLNPPFHRKKGGATMSQNITVAPGKVINDDGDLEQLELTPVTNEAMIALQASEARANRRVGSNFGPDMPTQAMRTAEGVQAFTNGVQAQLQFAIENVALLVFNPAIEAFIQLIKDNLQPDEIQSILASADEPFIGDILDIYNGEYAVDVLSSTKLAARRAVAQMMIPIMQMVGQPAFQQGLQLQGKKFDAVEFVKQVFDITGWPGDNLVVDMTPEDQQRMQMQNQALIKAQADAQLQQTQQQNVLEQIDRKGDVQAGVSVVKSALKVHEEPPEPLATKPKGKK